jgi:hypothetical protein
MHFFIKSESINFIVFLLFPTYLHEKSSEDGGKITMAGRGKKRNKRKIFGAPAKAEWKK